MTRGWSSAPRGLDRRKIVRVMVHGAAAGNRIGNDGVATIAKALTKNCIVMRIDLDSAFRATTRAARAGPRVACIRGAHRSAGCGGRQPGNHLWRDGDIERADEEHNGLGD